MKRGELREKVVESVEANHIWLSSTHHIRPTDEQLLELGRMVFNKLRDKENLLPSYHSGHDDEEVDEISKLTPVLYLSVNMS